ncbi:MAG: bifunctional phosphoserine phosphatase/homoserine phosphotransferase ThrH [Spirochaetaceae bacterium]|nr:MAG: bifunctional phosphoserine phosphatase/homoserine phosphotransferase ThrH [Spirochaetaceae bacterium]
MQVVCLDLEGVLIPEIWINVADRLGVADLRLTTRDIADYDELMQTRLRILAREKIKLKDIRDTIQQMAPLPGAREFVDTLQELAPLVILSDTFVQFAGPLMTQLGNPTLFCNELVIDDADTILGYRLRQQDGKRRAVEAFHSMNLKVTAAGDSYNDVSMLKEANSAAFFRAPEDIAAQFPQFPSFEDYGQLLDFICEQIGRQKS